MNNQNLIVYRFNLLYQILKEIEEDIQFKIIEISDEKVLEAAEIFSKNSYGKYLTSLVQDEIQ